MCELVVCMGAAGSAVVGGGGGGLGGVRRLFVCMGVAGSAVVVTGGEVWLWVCACGCVGGRGGMNG